MFRAIYESPDTSDYLTVFCKLCIAHAHTNKYKTWNTHTQEWHDFNVYALQLNILTDFCWLKLLEYHTTQG